MLQTHANTDTRVDKRRKIARIIIVCVLILGVIATILLILQAKSQPTRTYQSVAAFDSAHTIASQSWFNRTYDAGFRLYIFHSTQWGTCQPWERTQMQANMALKAGLMIAAYTRDPRCFKEGIEAFGPLKDHLQFFALDIETDPGIPVTRTMIDGIKALDVRPVIYTGSGMWPTIMGKTTEFSDVPLWDTQTSTFAYGDWVIDHLWPEPVEYAGWNTPQTMRIGVQQQFEYSLFGVQVDLNSFSADFLLQ